MRWETVALLVFGFLCGMTVMYILNRRQRIQEFNKIAEITEDILNERKVQAFSTGEETLYSKLEHQLVRVQEMLQGRSEEAERSRDEIQKLISQIAHQMRTPLMNMETYIGFLEDGKEQMSEELFFQSVDAFEEQSGKIRVSCGEFYPNGAAGAAYTSDKKRRAGSFKNSKKWIWTDTKKGGGKRDSVSDYAAGTGDLSA